LIIRDWDEIGDVPIGKYVGICDENSKVDVSEIVNLVDMDVVGIERDVSEVVMDVFGVDFDTFKVGVVVVKVWVDVMIIDMIDIDVGACINGFISIMSEIGVDDEVDEI
ncbi:hypothetical protein KI387_031563, partial [Taxus chinensis]